MWHRLNKTTCQSSSIQSDDIKEATYHATISIAVDGSIFSKAAVEEKLIDDVLKKRQSAVFR